MARKLDPAAQLKRFITARTTSRNYIADLKGLAEAAADPRDREMALFLLSEAEAATASGIKKLESNVGDHIVQFLNRAKSKADVAPRATSLAGEAGEKAALTGREVIDFLTQKFAAGKRGALRFAQRQAAKGGEMAPAWNKFGSVIESLLLRGKEVIPASEVEGIRQSATSLMTPKAAPAPAPVNTTLPAFGAAEEAAQAAARASGAEAAAAQEMVYGSRAAVDPAMKAANEFAYGGGKSAGPEKSAIRRLLSKVGIDTKGQMAKWGLGSFAVLAVLPALMDAFRAKMDQGTMEEVGAASRRSAADILADLRAQEITQRSQMQSQATAGQDPVASLLASQYNPRLAG